MQILELLTQQIQQYGFEHHLQALWQMYEQQQVIISTALPASADTLIQYYETTNFSDSRHINESNEINEIDDQSTVALYWLFLDSIKPVWTEAQLDYRLQSKPSAIVTRDYKWH